jgi:hypothetical protein
MIASHQKIERCEGCGALFAVELVCVQISGPCFDTPYTVCRACTPVVLQRFDDAHADAEAQLEDLWRLSGGGA